MAVREFETVQDIQAAIGDTIGPTEWVLVDQAKIDVFAEVTGDRNWVHVDAERAGASSFGATIAHGFLTLSLIGQFSPELIAIRDSPTTINYGLDKVRFPASCPRDSYVRATAQIIAVDPLERGCQLSLRYVIERQGSEKPVCVAEQLSRRLP